MRLYAGMSADFVEDAIQNRIASKLRDSFLRHFRFAPSPGEENSWRNSLRALSQVFQRGDLDDHGVILEYQLPLTSRRLDCLITGTDDEAQDEAVIIELKQWSDCEATEEPSIVRTFVGGANRDVLHPSAQVRQYRDYLADMHSAFYEGDTPIVLSACSYLHNYEAAEGDALYEPQYSELLKEAPLFSADDIDPLVDFLHHRLQGGRGKPVLERIEQSRFRPGKKLLEHVARVIRSEPSFVLLDEQKVVFDRILGTVVKAHTQRAKQIFLINGGPGTGKSVIAIQLMAELSRAGKNAQYATGSAAFTKTLKKIVGARAAAQFRYFNNYGDAEPSDVDVLICDEAHRLRPTSTNRFTPKAKQTKTSQIQEIVDAAKICVFFIDDRQTVRPGEVGSSTLIREAARGNNAAIREYALDAQFRCAGSDGFVNWIDNTLEVRRTANVLWNQREESFDFRILPTPQALENAIRARVAEGSTGRVTAGFCWPWSKELLPGGRLVEDVVVGDYRRAWNARSGAAGLAPGIPREVLWAYDPRGIDQVGCVYTAQGFEFDYIGIIWGPDLAYNAQRAEWRGDRTKSRDWVVRRSGDRFTDLVKNTYRVLLSRGLKGCYVYFIDKDTETFVRSRTEGLGAIDRPPAVSVRHPGPAKAPVGLPSSMRRLSAEEIRPYANSVPLIELEIAAGYFSDEQQSTDASHWVTLPDDFRITPGLFVARVAGESMNRRIPNGSWCLFRANPVGSRENKIVVAQHREISDTDNGTHVTVKRYHSEKTESEDGGWRHVRIVLSPESTEPQFKPIELSPKQSEELKIVAEYVAVLG